MPEDEPAVMGKRELRAEEESVPRRPERWAAHREVRVEEGSLSQSPSVARMRNRGVDRMTGDVDADVDEGGEVEVGDGNEESER